MINEIVSKINFDLSSDRLGPDCPFTHWRLYIKTLQMQLCKNKFAHFDKGAEFRAGAYAVTCSKIHLGKNVVIRPSTMIFADPSNGSAGSVYIEDNVMLGSGVHIYVSNHKYDMPGVDIINQGHSPAKSVTLRKGCWVGANSIILPGVTIGVNSVVAAGSIVTKNVDDFTVVAGNPAKKIKDIAQS